MKISKIIIYDEPSVSEIQTIKLKNFLEKTFPVTVEVKNSIFNEFKPNTAFQIASCRIYNPKRPFEKHYPSKEEIIFEEKNFLNTSINENIVMYDGFELLQCLTELIPNEEQNRENFHVIFTNKLTCSFDYNDFRYHGRALIGGNPSLISTTGIIEAPAKPREFYLDLIKNHAKGINREVLNQRYKGTFLEYNDPRLSKIIEGYLLQAIFYFETGQPFCNKKDCRLFNAHWQKELLDSQIKIAKLCDAHEKILESFQS